jgi:hypothetical protein
MDRGVLLLLGSVDWLVGSMQVQPKSLRPFADSLKRQRPSGSDSSSSASDAAAQQQQEGTHTSDKERIE